MNAIIHACVILAVIGGTLAQSVDGTPVSDDGCPTFGRLVTEADLENAVITLSNFPNFALLAGESDTREMTLADSRSNSGTTCYRMKAENNSGNAEFVVGADFVEAFNSNAPGCRNQEGLFRGFSGTEGGQANDSPVVFLAQATFRDTC